MCAAVPSVLVAAVPSLILNARIPVAGFVAGAATSGFKHYYQRFAEEEDMNDGTITQVEIVSDKTKKTRGRK